VAACQLSVSYWRVVTFAHQVVIIMKNKEPNIESWRCQCGKQLFKGALLVAYIQVKCTRCKHTNTIVRGVAKPAK
jgi:phage FluMu protein Com